MAAEQTPETQAERFADALYVLLQERALSWGLVDIGIEVHGATVDCELLFGGDPDMGLSVEVSVGAARFCVLIGDAQERWLDEGLDDLPFATATSDEAVQELVLAVADGLLAARRPLLQHD